jgi:hypothetical protein
VLVAAILTGCAHARVSVHEPDVTAVTYVPLAGATLARTTGRLRRLAFSAPPFERSPRDPRWCLDPCDADAYGRDFEARVRELLTDWRGYELVPFDGSPPPDVDGVLVVKGRIVYLTWLDALAWVASFTFAIPLSAVRIGPSAEAKIYETASGRLVWQSRASAIGEITPAADIADALFEPLELAWPQALTRPVGLAPSWELP